MTAVVTKVAAISLNEDDMGFVDQVSMLFPIPGGLAFAVLSGSDAEINNVINHFHAGIGDAALSLHTKDWMSSYNGPLLAPVQAVCKDFADRMKNQPKTVFDHMEAFVHMDRQSRYTAYYDKYLAR